MEFKKLIKLLKKHSKTIYLTGALFGFLGAVFFFLFPRKYKAIGSFYVVRDTERLERVDFTYEGFYAQQAGINHASNLTALLESVDIRKEALEDLEIAITAKNLRKMLRNMDVKRASPQLVTLTVKGKTAEEARFTWESVSDATVRSSIFLNRQSGDPLLRVLKVQREPVVVESYQNIFVDIVVGALFGLLISSSTVIFRKYFS